MSAEVANTVVMVVFGILLGVILKLFGAIADRSGAASGPANRSWRERVGDAFDREKLRAENQSRLQSMPRSGWIAMIFIYGLVAMLVLVVRLSPVTMRWWTLLGSVLGGFMIASFVFNRTAAQARRESNSREVT